MASSEDSNWDDNTSQGHDEFDEKSSLLLINSHTASVKAHARALKGKQILAPIDLAAANESFKIFSLECPGGYWLHSLASSLVSLLSGNTVSIYRPQPQHYLVGGYFPGIQPCPAHMSKYINLVECHPERGEDWPLEMHGEFDLVNVSLVVGHAMAEGVSPPDILRSLVLLLKPGGWLQITDLPLREPPAEQPETTKAATVMYRVFTAHHNVRATLYSQPKRLELEKWIKEAGLETVNVLNTTVPVIKEAGKNATKEEEEEGKTIARGMSNAFSYQIRALPKAMALLEQRRLEAIIARKRGETNKSHRPLGMKMAEERLETLMTEMKLERDEEPEEDRDPADFSFVSDLPMPMDELEAFSDHFEDLILREGVEQVFQSVWGRKPLSSADVMAER